MISVISSLLYRLFRSVYFYVCLAIAVFAPLLQAGTIKLLLIFAQSLPGAETVALAADPLTLLAAETNVTSTMATLVVIAVGLLIGSDFSQGLVRNAIIANKKRTEIYGAYMISMVILILIYCTAGMLSASVLYISILGNIYEYSAGYYIGSAFAFYGLQLLSMTLIGTMTVFLCVGFKRVSTPLILGLLIVNVGLPLILAGSQLTVIFGTGQYEALTWIPIFNLSMLTSTMDGALMAKCVVGLLIPIAALTVGMPFYFKKTDIR